MFINDPILNGLVQSPTLKWLPQVLIAGKIILCSGIYFPKHATEIEQGFARKSSGWKHEVIFIVIHAIAQGLSKRAHGGATNDGSMSEEFVHSLYVAYENELLGRFKDHPRCTCFVQGALFLVARGWFWTTGDTICENLVCLDDSLYCQNPRNDLSISTHQLAKQISEAIVAEFEQRGLMDGNSDRLIEFIRRNTAWRDVTDKNQPIYVKNPEMTPYEHSWAIKVDELYHEFEMTERKKLQQVDERFVDSDDEIFQNPNWISLNKPALS